MTTPRIGQITAPPFKNSHIDDLASALVKRFEAVAGRDHLLKHGMRFRELYEQVIYPDYEIELVEDVDLAFDSAGKKVLGVYDVEGNTVMIDRSINEQSGDPRRTFTLHHEVLGHGVLQGSWLRQERERFPNFLVSTEESIGSEVVSTLERQANRFAAITSAPPWLVDAALILTFRPTKPFVYLRPSQYWLDVRGTSRPYDVTSHANLCERLAFFIRDWFDGLSVQSLSYRVSTSRLVADRSLQIMLRRAAV